MSSKWFLLFLQIAPCTVRVPKVINIRTKQSFASIAIFITENTWTNWKTLFMICSLRIKIVPQNICQLLYITSKILEIYKRCLCPTFNWNLRPRIRARYHSDILSSRSSTDEDCRTALLFIPYRPRVIHALPWGERLLHFEWHCTLQTFLYVNMVSLTTKQFTIWRANIFYLPQA